MLRGPNEGFEIVREESHEGFEIVRKEESHEGFEIVRKEELPYRHPTETSWMVKDKLN